MKQDIIEDASSEPLHPLDLHDAARVFAWIKAFSVMTECFENEVPNDGGGSSHLCSCNHLENWPHEEHCGRFVKSAEDYFETVKGARELLVAEQQLLNCDGSNSLAESYDAWREALERVAREDHDAEVRLHGADVVEELEIEASRRKERDAGLPED